ANESFLLETGQSIQAWRRNQSELNFWMKSWNILRYWEATDMTFQKIVWKMAKYHYKKYLFYFLCNSAAVLFIFVFMTLYLNEYIVSVKQSEGLVYVLSIPGAALIMFTIFFISYAHQIFMKKRRS